MIRPYNFFDRILKITFKITLDSYHINHAISILTITPKYIEREIDKIYFKKILKEMVVIYARLLNQYKFKHHSYFRQDIINP